MHIEDFDHSGADILMPLETPLLKVSRPVAACQRCRQAKIKCDGKLPACSACERSNRASECSSTNDQFARGKERSYVATLESRVERLERKIGDAKARRKSSLQMLDSAISPRRVSIGEDGKPRNPRLARKKELHDIDELVSDFGFLTVNATSRDFYGFTSAISYSRLILAAAGRDLPEGMRQDLPPRYAAQPLIQHFINTLYLVLPVVEETSLYASLDAVYNPDTSNVSNLDHWNVRLVLAIASCMKSSQRGDAMYTNALGHVSEALEVADKVLHPGSVWSIQAMLLLVLYATFDPAHFDSWTLIGAASRMMIDLGMHQDPSKSVNMSKLKLDLRRRVFWCVYALDRSTSIVQTRAFSFSDDGANVALPFSRRAARSPSTSQQNRSPWEPSNDTALEFLKLRQMQSTWYTDLLQSGRDAWLDPYLYIWRKYNDMYDWFAQISSTTLPAVRDYFELELLYSYVYLLSPNPRCPLINEHAQQLLVEHAMVYAHKMHSIVTSPTEAKNALTFHDAVRVYMTGRSFLDCLSKNVDGLLQPQASTPHSITGASQHDLEVDPMAATAPPQIPPPPTDTSGTPLKDPTSRAIDAIGLYIDALSYFGIRFGSVAGIDWRDRFQRESQFLLSQLYQRRSSFQAVEHNLMRNAGGPVTPPTQLGSPSGSATYYPSPPSTHYSPSQPFVTASQTHPGWTALANQQSTPNYAMPSMPDMSGASMAHVGFDNLGIPTYAAYETLPGGHLNVRFS